MNAAMLEMFSPISLLLPILSPPRWGPAGHGVQILA